MIMACEAARRAGHHGSAILDEVDIAAAETIPAQLGDRLLYDSSGITGGALAGSPIEHAILGHVRDSFIRQKSHLAHLPGSTFSSSGSALRSTLWCSAQATMRSRWSVLPASWDGRSPWLTAAPPTRTLRVSRKPNKSSSSTLRSRSRASQITRETAVVMMTHNYPQDARLLRSILPARPRYLGMLGPKSRTRDLLAEVDLPIAGIDLHAPIGLDLGSDAPESIALAIVAEIQAVLGNRAGGMLKQRAGSIHDAVLESGLASPDLVTNTEAPICELV